MSKKTLTKIPFALLTWIIFYWVLTAISPVDRHDWLMENILFFIFFAVLIFSYRSFPFSNISYLLLTIFLTLHLTGAHYTYSKVPLGFYLAEIFGESRNHFDRIVHFSFGLLLTYPIREFLLRMTRLKGFFSYYLPVDIILSCSALFEIIEWLFVMNVNPDLGAAYLGTQGDIWDAQKDMVVAAIGSVVATLIIFVSLRFRK